MDRLCVGINTLIIGLKIFLIAGDQIASHAGFLVHHGVHDVLQRFQYVGGVDACVFGQFNHAEPVVQDGWRYSQE